MQTRRQLISQMAWGLAATAVPFAARANTLESAKIIAGFAPGGTIDTEARRVAARLTGSYAKAVIVDNRPGAGGQIAISALKASPADGTTLLVTPMSMLGIYPHTYKKLPYDPLVDLTPVSTAVQVDMGFAVGPLVPASVTTIPEFLAWCNANPTQANFGSPAPGSVPHFVGVLIGRAGKVDLRHIGFRGTQPAIMDLVGGQIAAVSAPVGEFLPHLPGGKLRILATSGATRSKFVPQVATLAEQGYKSLVYGEWHGFFLPGKASAAVVNQANAEIRKALGAKEVVDGLAAMGLEVRASSPEELAAALKADLERWGPIVKSIGFTADA
ncbi:MAG: twin-arginine translocation pathway signal protein [Acidovorax sp. SCN 65-28]|uniref:Bug family tripartite tricarboxylate transporter substrate binding protein n=1 Tax=Acidovorax sp. TaxID=1872122 RepID=UPI0008693094|nr:Bug family tripartite tricarboxylate transporter substrate binding protein [Acidovorax sp.]MBN9628247.1 Bug family tripartite tricarboxylate transporter substrate binding protein [Acidovorax sp.]ODS79330.1 MAG: twin-arginine translocation pathway signal protein [Acidovorax sp. SCN 65-28]